MGRRIRTTAFTLVELLIEIGIIAVLISILLPVGMKVRRRAMALASPVAYVSRDVSVNIVHPAGRTALDLAPANCLCWTDSGPQGPFWSTNGTYVGHIVHVFGTGGSHYVAIVNPASGRVIKHMDLGAIFSGWADDTHFLIAREGTVEVREAESGVVTETYRGLGRIDSTLAPADGPGGACFVTAMDDYRVGMAIVLLRRDFTRCKIIWRQESGAPWLARAEPRMDPFGRYVAWTTEEAGSGFRRKIWIKAVNEPAAHPPLLLGGNYADAALLDWTEGGDLLAAVRTNVGYESKLVVIDTAGQVKSEVPTDGVLDWSSKRIPGTGSWRKYLRR